MNRSLGVAGTMTVRNCSFVQYVRMRGADSLEVDREDGVFGVHLRAIT